MISDRTIPTTNPDRLFPQHQTAIAPHHTQNPIAFSQIKQRSPLNTHKTRSPIPTSNSDRHSTPVKPDRLFPHQPAIAPYYPQTRSPISPSNSDRPLHPQTRSPISHIKQRSPLTTTNPIAYFPNQTAIVLIFTSC